MKEKGFKLYREKDIKKWRKIKKKVINKENNPDLQDTKLLRRMMEVYEENKL